MAYVIQTKFVGPTEVKGARIKAKHHSGSLTQSYNHAWDETENHQCCAELLAVKIGLTYKNIETGTLPDGSYAHFLY